VAVGTNYTIQGPVLGFIRSEFGLSSADAGTIAPASAQAFVGWGGLMTAIFGPPLVGSLLDATGDFALGFLIFAAIVAAVLCLTPLIRPFDLAAAD